MNKDILNILYCFDNNYTKQALTSIHSLLENLQESINIFIIFNKDDLLQNIPDKIIKHKNLNNLNIYKFSDTNHNFPNISNAHISEATYYRMFISNYIPREINYIIYVDADMIFIKDPIETINKFIQKLNDTKFIFGARTDQKISEGIELDKFERLNLNKSYFNAGFLIINFKKWNQENFTSKLLQKMYELNNNILHWDQDVMNSTVNGEYLEIDEKLNFNSMKLTKNSEIPFVIHYIGSKKPWFTSGLFNFSSNFYHENYKSIFDNFYHIEHKWKLASLKEVFFSFLNLKVFKLTHPLMFVIEFVLSLFKKRNKY